MYPKYAEKCDLMDVMEALSDIESARPTAMENFVEIFRLIEISRASTRLPRMIYSVPEKVILGFLSHTIY